MFKVHPVFILFESFLHTFHITELKVTLLLNTFFAVLPYLKVFDLLLICRLFFIENLHPS